MLLIVAPANTRILLGRDLSVMFIEIESDIGLRLFLLRSALP